MTDTVDNTKKGPNKLVKGTIAAAAGVALLLGGAGTFALWNDSRDIGVSADINSGRLYFDGEPSGGAWAWAGDRTGQGTFNPATQTLVPGDTVTYTVTSPDIVAEGTNLRATLSADVTGTVFAASNEQQGSQELADVLDVDVDVNGQATQEITEDDAGESVNVVVTITFPDVDARTAQNGSVTLDGDVTLSLQQHRNFNAA